MKLFVHEFVTGGGTWQTIGAIEPAGSILAEGAAMATALVADLVAAGIEVATTLDSRLQQQVEFPCAVEVVAGADEEETAFRRLVRWADAVFLIAPEFGGSLLQRCRLVEELGGKLVSPGSRFVAIAADKQATAERLAAQGVPMPAGMRLSAPLGDVPDDLFPAVVKPCDGAGSWLVQRVETRQDLSRLIFSADYEESRSRGTLRLERIAPGTAASVAVLCGPAELVPLTPCEQILGRSGFEYLGGRLPLGTPLAERAQQLALRAVQALPSTSGYVGVDVVLGRAQGGSEDMVIEVNPRLTTSYVGLRAACRQNLAAAILAIAAGAKAAVSFSQAPVEFRADGTVCDSSCASS